MRLICSDINLHRTRVFFLMKKGKSAIFWIQTGLHIRLYPRRLTPHPQILAGAHNFPPHLSGVPPDPVPPLRLQTRCLSICVCQS